MLKDSKKCGLAPASFANAKIPIRFDVATFARNLYNSKESFSGFTIGYYQISHIVYDGAKPENSSCTVLPLSPFLLDQVQTTMNPHIFAYQKKEKEDFKTAQAEVMESLRLALFKKMVQVCGKTDNLMIIHENETKTLLNEFMAYLEKEKLVKPSSDNIVELVKANISNRQD